MATIDPYQSVSCFEALLRWRHPSDKECTISHKRIEIPNRVFSTEDGRNYDIYNLAIRVLKESRGPGFPENFTQKDREKFCQFFKLSSEGFPSLWGGEELELWALVVSKGGFADVSFGESLKARARLQIFAASISRSQRSTLNQYFHRPIKPFRSVLVDE